MMEWLVFGLNYITALFKPVKPWLKETELGAGYGIGKVCNKESCAVYAYQVNKNAKVYMMHDSNNSFHGIKKIDLPFNRHCSLVQATKDDVQEYLHCNASIFLHSIYNDTSNNGTCNAITLSTADKCDTLPCVKVEKFVENNIVKDHSSYVSVNNTLPEVYRIQQDAKTYVVEHVTCGLIGKLRMPFNASYNSDGSINEEYTYSYLRNHTNVIPKNCILTELDKSTFKYSCEIAGHNVTFVPNIYLLEDHAKILGLQNVHVNLSRFNYKGRHHYIQSDLYCWNNNNDAIICVKDLNIPDNVKIITLLAYLMSSPHTVTLCSLVKHTIGNFLQEKKTRPPTITKISYERKHRWKKAISKIKNLEQSLYVYNEGRVKSYRSFDVNRLQDLKEDIIRLSKQDRANSEELEALDEYIKDLEEAEIITELKGVWRIELKDCKEFLKEIRSQNESYFSQLNYLHRNDFKLRFESLTKAVDGIEIGNEGEIEELTQSVTKLLNDVKRWRNISAEKVVGYLKNVWLEKLDEIRELNSIIYEHPRVQKIVRKAEFYKNFIIIYSQKTSEFVDDDLSKNTAIYYDFSEELSSNIDTLLEEANKLKIGQLGWNCFDIAIGLSEIPKIKLLYSQKQLSWLAGILGIESVYPKEESSWWKRILGVELSDPLEIAYQARKSLVELVLEKALDRDYRRLLAPEIYNTMISHIIKICNNTLSRCKNKELFLDSLDKLKKFFQYENNQDDYPPDVLKNFNFVCKIEEYIKNIEAGTAQYDIAEIYYRTHIQKHYAQCGEFTIQRNIITGEYCTSMIDVVAKLLDLKIVIYDRRQKIIYQTEQYRTKKVSINYNGSNHFTARSTSIEFNHFNNLSNSTKLANGTDVFNKQEKNEQEQHSREESISKPLNNNINEVNISHLIQASSSMQDQSQASVPTMSMAVWASTTNVNLVIDPCS